MRAADDRRLNECFEALEPDETSRRRIEQRVFSELGRAATDESLLLPLVAEWRALVGSAPIANLALSAAAAFFLVLGTPLALGAIALLS
jgi:hypothetical protein